MNIPESRPLRWKAIGLLCLVFALGIATGVGGGALVFRRSLQQKITTGTAGGLLVDRLEREMVSKLDLTPAEEAAIQPEFETARRQIRLQRLQMLRALRETSEETLARVKAKLPPEKQALLETNARKRLRPWGLLRER